jgi:hypothetical protein
VRVTLDENEVQRRIQQERDEIKRAAEDAGASAEPTRKESEPKGSV